MRALVGLTASLLLLGMSMPVALSDDEPTFQQLLEETLPGIGAERIEDRKNDQQRLQEACLRLGAPGREAERGEACRLIAARLGIDTAKPARIWLLKQLEFIGRGECVAAVAALLSDSDQQVRDAARRALANNPAAAANATLLAKLAEGGAPSWRVALINSLGFRADRSSVGPLARVLADEDETVAAAAANALGKIGGEQAARALDTAGGPRPLRVHVIDALLRCADKLLEEGRSDGALAIYKKLYGPGMPRATRLAALQGQLNAAGDSAGAVTLALLRSEDADARAIAAGHMARVLSPATLQEFTEAFSDLPVPGKLLLIAAVAAAGDKAAMPLALSAAGSDDEPVRLAGLRALAKLGDASAVPALLEAMAVEGDAAGAARESLQRVFGEGVDEAIIAAMQRAEIDMRGTLIDVLNARGAVAAAPALLKEAAHEDAGIRTRAMRALGNLAEPEHLPAMTSALLSYDAAGECEEAEKAIVRVCERTAEPEGGADRVVAALTGADEAGRRVLLPLAGRIGGEKALAAVQEALRSDQEETRDAAIAALCNWPDASVADQLLELAGNADKQEHRRSALGAYVRVIESRPERERLAMYQQAMALAERDHERKAVLKAVASARSVEALRWVVPYLDNPALAMDASRAVVELARHGDLRGANRDEFRAALNKVLDVIDDAGLLDRAKRHLGEL